MFAGCFLSRSRVRDVSEIQRLVGASGEREDDSSRAICPYLRLAVGPVREIKEACRGH